MHRPVRSITARTAFFISTTCEANINHFLLDEFARVHATLRAFGVPLGRDNRHAADTNVTLLYRHDLHSFCHEGCHDPTKFEDFLFTLPVTTHLAYYRHRPACFREAVFGTITFDSIPKEAMSFIVDNFLESSPSPKKSSMRSGALVAQGRLGDRASRRGTTERAVCAGAAEVGRHPLFAQCA